MSPNWLIPFAIIVLTVLAMELVATLVHRFVMHGRGWAWHRSHHEPSTGLMERNDLYAVTFALFSLLLFIAGKWWEPLWWVGAGTVVYGFLYTFVHDGMVHGRFRFFKAPRSGYLKRLVQAHRLHHAVSERDGAVSYGFLYAPPVARLREQVRARLGGQ
jgi:beta-carotene 3-hydroxylase